MTDYRCHARGHYENGELWSTQLHITSNQTRAALLTTFQNAWVAAWTNGTYGLQTLYPTTTVMDSWDVYELDANMKATFKSSNASATPGTSSDNGLPNEVTITEYLRGAGVTRNQRGYMHLPAPVEGIVVNGVYTSTAGTRVTTAIGALLAAIRADGSTIFSYPKIMTKTGVPAFTKTVLLTNVTSLRPGSQTRRAEETGAIYV